MGKRQAGSSAPAPLSWRVELETAAVRQYRALEAGVRERIAEMIDDLARHPRLSGAKKRSVSRGYRCRTGDWRVLYTVDDKARLVRVYRLGHRGDDYRGL